MSKKVLIPFLAAILLLNGFLFLSITKKKTGDNPYPHIDIARNFISQEDFIINLQPLREWLIEYVKQSGNNRISLYIEFLNTGANISINKELRIYPASLPKLPLAMVVVKEIEEGKIKFSDTVEIKERHLNEGSGNLYTRGIGSFVSIRELLKELLINSDNTAYKLLLEIADPEDLNDIIDEVGLEQLFDDDGKVSAKEYSRFFRALYTSSFLTRQNSEYLLDLLGTGTFKDYLSSGIPDDVFFAHKYGENKEVMVFLDSGIVYIPKRPYIISVMIEGDKNIKKEDAVFEVREIMNKISSETYKYFKTSK